MRSRTKTAPPAAVLGWREWVALPDLGVERIKCKIDTGARTSSLHALAPEYFRRDGQDWVRFAVKPGQDKASPPKRCESRLIDQRAVTDSGGHREQRMVIGTTIVIGNNAYPIELTLTDRDTMRFRMLLGRTAIRGHYLVDAGRSYLAGPPQRGQHHLLNP